MERLREIKNGEFSNIVAPILESNKLYLQRRYQDFIGELIEFPRGHFVDQLDAFAYHVQLIKSAMVNRLGDASMLAANLARAGQVNQPYSIGMAN